MTQAAPVFFINLNDVLKGTRQYHIPLLRPACQPASVHIKGIGPSPCTEMSKSHRQYPPGPAGLPATTPEVHIHECPLTTIQRSLLLSCPWMHTYQLILQRDVDAPAGTLLYGLTSSHICTCLCPSCPTKTQLSRLKTGMPLPQPFRASLMLTYSWYI